MFKRDQPLFSRPVLAAIIVVSTLAVWLLNLTAPTVDLTTPEVNQWRTESGIPVTLITQEAWQTNDQLTVSFVFNGDTNRPQLTATTLAMLTGPSLPLSTATLNQRLNPLAAKAETLFTQQHQYFTLTMSNQARFLTPSFKLFDTWLNQTHFKATALSHVQRQQHPDPAQQQLRQQLMPQSTDRHADDSVDLAQLTQYLDHLKQRVSHIVVAGAMDQDAYKVVLNGLNQLTASMSPADTPTPKRFAHQPHISTVGDGEPTVLYGGVALTPLHSVQDWLALQIWARDLLDQQKQRFGSEVVQWQLHLAPPSPYALWQIQLPTHVLQDGSQSTSVESAWVAPSDLPSYHQQPAFSALKQSLLTRLKDLSQTPQWWTQIGTRVTPADGVFSLQHFAQDYSEAANSFTMTQYQQRIDDLLRPTSRQEVQVKP